MLQYFLFPSQNQNIIKCKVSYLNENNNKYIKNIQINISYI